MRTGLVMLVGAGVLSLAVGADSATAAVRHHYRHVMAHPHYMQAPAPRAEFIDLSTSGNNPAKRYPTRHMPDGAIRTATLPQSGNNPAKRYAVRHAPANAIRQPTLMTKGNNPAKRYAVTASR
jgi:hypothetical protein